MAGVDAGQLADLLRTRREALQPEDVGLPRGARRRTAGLRREEVAALSGMSTDYYARLEQRRGPQPSEQMLAAIARGLHLSLDERDHLFRVAGHQAPQRALRAEHVDAGLMRVLDRLTDTPAAVMSGLGETLLQTPPAVALFGDETRYTGHARCVTYRWWTDISSRAIYPERDWPQHGRWFTAELREAYTREGPGSTAAAIVEELQSTSAEFRSVWAEHSVERRRSKPKRLVHPEVGELDVYCQILYDVDQSQGLLVFTATPGTESHEKLQFLAMLGARPPTS